MNKPIQFNKKRRLDQSVELQTISRDRMTDVKSRGKPLGGAPPVKIPPLDADPIEHGGSMQEQASVLQDPSQPLSPFYDPQLAESASMEGVHMDPRELRRRKQQMTQTVPPEAEQDPMFRKGIGSAFIANQPDVQPHRTRSDEVPGKPVLSDESRQSLKELEAFQQQAQEAQVESASEQTRQGEEQVQGKIQDNLANELGIDDPEEFFKSLQREMSDLDNPEVRKSIEDRLQPLSLEQLLTEGEAHQDVPIVRGKLIVTYRTVSGEEDLAIKRGLYGEKGSDRYLFDRLGIMQLACGLHSINGEPLPNHLKDSGAFDQDLFVVKFKRVRRFPMPLLASLGVNFQWFDQRSRRLFIDVGELKNG